MQMLSSESVLDQGCSELQSCLLSSLNYLGVLVTRFTANTAIYMRQWNFAMPLVTYFKNTSYKTAHRFKNSVFFSMYVRTVKHV